MGSDRQALDAETVRRRWSKTKRMLGVHVGVLLVIWIVQEVGPETMFYLLLPVLAVSVIVLFSVFGSFVRSLGKSAGETIGLILLIPIAGVLLAWWELSTAYEQVIVQQKKPPQKTP